MHPQESSLRKRRNYQTKLVRFSDSTSSHWQAAAFVGRWASTLVWAAAIFFFSTEGFVSHVSRTVLGQVFGNAGLTVSTPTLDSLNSLARILAHVTEYGILAALLYTSLCRPILCVAIASAYALTDEFHQLFVPGRGASLLDCGLDALGASLAMCIIYTVRNRTRR